MRYSYMPTDECRKHITEWSGSSSDYWFNSTQTNIHFHNQYGRIFVLIDRKKLIWFNVILSVMWFVIGRITG